MVEIHTPERAAMIAQASTSDPPRVGFVERLASEPPPGERLALGLGPGVSLAEEGRDELTAAWGFGRLIFRSLPGGVRGALCGLGEGVSRHELATRVLAVDGPPGLARLYYHLRQLEERGLLERSARRGPSRLAVLRPLGGAGFRRTVPAPFPLRGDRSYVVSSLALLRRQGRGVVAESPLGWATVVLEDALALEVVLGLLQPAGVDELIRRLEGRAGFGLDRSIEEILQLLIEARIISEAGFDGSTDEERDPRLAMWSSHDLYFHQRSRFGRHQGSFGATFPHVGRLAPPAAVRPPSGTKRIELVKPDLASLHAREPSLGEVMERRASLRSYSSQAMSLEQLATFLYRVARVKETATFEVASPDGREQATVEITSRPYPGGGRAHELELYLAIRACEGVEAGLFHYDPLGHALEEVRPLDTRVDALLRYSCVSALIAEPPPILIVIATRIARVAWKYDTIAYATVLKDVGVLYQTMYLVSTAMGLAPCALGSGSPDMFADATGLDPLVETSVGEFMLGLPERDDHVPSIARTEASHG